jgi:ABC-type glycerol-3-phosphate transport system substrate-binding protein
MKSQRVLTALLLAAVLVGAAFAGGKQETAKTEAPGKVKITYWHFPFVHSVAGYEQVSKEYGDWEVFLAQEFMKENQDVEVATELLPWEGGVDKINVAIAGGNPPELVFDYLGRTGGWYQQGAAVPLDNLISETLKSDLQDAFKSLYTINGKLHAVPGIAWNTHLVVNRGLLKKMGYTGNVLNGPGGTYTYQQFEELLAAIKQKTEPGTYPFAIACGSEQGDYLWWGFFWGFGARLFNPDGSTVSASPEMVEGYKWLLALSDRGLMAPGAASMTGSDTMHMWSSGKVVVHGGNKTYANMIMKGINDGVLDFELDVTPIPFPTRDGKSSYSAMGPTGFVVLTKDAARQKATARFIEFMMQPKYWLPQVQGAGQFPATKSVAQLNPYQGDALMTVTGDMLARFPAGDFALSNPNYNKIRIAMAAAGQAIFSKMKSPEAAVAEFLAEVKKLNGK